jgi:outer membrane protein assembly factor BamB
MKNLLACMLAFLVGFVIACLVPEGDGNVEPTPMIAAAPVPASTETPPTDEPAHDAGDPSSDPAAPGPVAPPESPPPPVPTDPPAKVASLTVVDPAVAPASVERPAGRDWPQWGGSPSRNNAPRARNIPTDWAPGRIDRRSGEWHRESAQNIKWVARLGSETYGNPVVAGGRVFVGTNNVAAYLPRYPKDVDLGCLLCFAESDGSLLWQYSSEKLTQRDLDWPMQGICCCPLVDGDRLWLITNRGEVVCLDAEGFYDGENDGPHQQEPSPYEKEADVIWKFDMMKELAVRQHNMASCSVTSLGDLLFVNTSNGVDESEIRVAAPDAPSFLAMDKKTGELVWSDSSPGENILHGQWSSPAAGILGGEPQVVFAGGDGWLYSFRADRGSKGRPTPLWRFDCNPKDSEWLLAGRGTRNNIIATPVLHGGFVYVATGQDPENGVGQGRLWCIDPSRRGDVSPQLVVRKDDPSHIVPHRRVKAVDAQRGETVVENPNSAVVWQYAGQDGNEDGQIGIEETMHRTMGTVAIAQDLLFVADFAGLFHCINVKTGQPHWVYDMLAGAWGSPLITDNHVYIGDEDGEVAVFRLTSQPHDPVAEIYMHSCVYSTPIVANDVLYITNRTHLFAIAKDARRGSEPVNANPE